MKQLLLIIAMVALVGGCGEDKKPPEIMHTCQWCLEEVKVGAAACKHCGKDPYGRDLEQAMIEIAVERAQIAVGADRELSELEADDSTWGERFGKRYNSWSEWMVLGFWVWAVVMFCSIGSLFDKENWWFAWGLLFLGWLIFW